MKKILILPLFFMASSAFCQVSCEYENIVSELKKNCTGINEELQKIKKYETAGTVISGIGTVAAGGAIYAGIKKKDLDEKAEELSKEMDSVETMSDQEFVSFLKEVAAFQEEKEMFDYLVQQEQNFQEKSKKLGNVRTGLMVGDTATAVTGTILSSKSKKESESIKDMIGACLETIKNNEQKIGQTIFDCPNGEYKKLITAVATCRVLSTENMEKVSKQNKISTIVSGVNIGTGTAGIITSALANNKKEYDDKTKNLNNTANVLAGTSAVASGISTAFNAATIQSINNNLRASAACETAINEL